MGEGRHQRERSVSKETRAAGTRVERAFGTNGTARERRRRSAPAILSSVAIKGFLTCHGGSVVYFENGQVIPFCSIQLYSLSRIMMTIRRSYVRPTTVKLLIDLNTFADCPIATFLHYIPQRNPRSHYIILIYIYIFLSFL